MSLGIYYSQHYLESFVFREDRPGISISVERESYGKICYIKKGTVPGSGVSGRPSLQLATRLQDSLPLL